MTLSRRNIVALPAVAAISAAVTDAALANTQALAPNATPKYADWFKFSDKVLEKWLVLETPSNPNIVTLRPKRLPQGQGRRVLMIYPRPSSAYDIAVTKIMNVFEDKLLDVEITVENYRLNPAVGKSILDRAQHDNVSLIMAMGSETTAWLWEVYNGGRIPVVTVCSKDPVVLGQIASYRTGSGNNFAYTSLNMPINVQMAYVHELKPRLRNIAVLVDSRNVSAIETQAKPVADYAKTRGIRVLELAVQDPNNARAELERMVRDAANQMSKNDPDLSNSIFWVTGSTSVFREIATVNANAGRAAVLSVVPEIVRGGDDSAVLSIGISFESNAHLAAVYAYDIIRGRVQAKELKVGVVSPPDIAISFRKLRDIGMTVPLSFFEAASTVYDYDGRPVRLDGVTVASNSSQQTQN
ncbi:MAG: ABC transporter substrate-binding protein [Beijerinckiaceae bacterium]